MGQSTPTQDQVTPDERENTVPMSVGQSILDGPPPDWISIDNDEVLLWESSQSSKQLLPDILLSLLLIGVGGVLMSIGQLQILGAVPSSVQLLVTVAGLVFVILALLSFGYNWWSYRQRRYAVTTDATYRKWGDHVSKIEMEKISTVTNQRYSWVDGLFSCGDLKIIWQNNGPESTTYPAVRHPDQVQEIIMDTVCGTERDSSL